MNYKPKTQLKVGGKMAELMKTPSVTEWVFSQGDDLKTDSRIVAKVFKKEHKNVLRDIRELIGRDSEFARLNFELLNKTITYVDKDGEEKETETAQTSHYIMTFDGFIMLVMGYSGEEAFKIKLQYIKVFNAMRKLLTDNQYSLIEQLHKAVLAEKVSSVMGTLAGKALNRRKTEKRLYQPEIERLKRELQPDLFSSIYLN
ncbi:Rha family transcriptional regulator [Suttonella ornithocola]|uniref:Uncharacterized phage-encoded protein n=1 Tax=Suttonella ornithocola TaxID=279832 RepID=A0A380MT75_9GAMM|nr:Rha family transcriptional regulator [Suttonella ornithocola]SUO95266.1 Uncharacterized phage-encoded protein [Suttonella ornithocola]